MTTRAAEGLWRRRWGVAEIEAMVRAGIVAENERFELVEGEVVPMSPKGIAGFAPDLSLTLAGLALI